MSVQERCKVLQWKPAERLFNMTMFGDLPIEATFTLNRIQFMHIA